MKASWLVVLCLISCGLSEFRISAQELYQQKDLGFAQVAVGPTIETVITLTNRGPHEYTGLLLLSQGEEGLIWNPFINGEAAVDGEYAVVIGIDETITLRLTADTLQSGAGVLVGDDLIPDNFVEAALSYYVRSDDRIVDSVGVLATQEFYLATIPFEDFSTVGLALANAAVFFGVEDTQIVLSLLDSAGNLVADKRFGLPPYGHDARFLFEHFPDVSLGRGKLEIFATSPVIGTALTLVGPPDAPQLSTLPLFPSPTAYDFTITASGGNRFEGVMALWAEGYFVRGYLVVVSVDGVELPDWKLTLVNGQLIDGFLDLSFFAESQNFYGELQENEEMTVYLGHTDFTFADSSVSGGRFILLYLADQASVTGDFELTRITP